MEKIQFLTITSFKDIILMDYTCVSNVLEYQLCHENDEMQTYNCVWWYCVTVAAAWDLREKLWQAFSHSRCHKGVHAGNDKDNQP